MGCYAKADGATDRGYLADDGNVFEVRQAGAAIFFRDDDAHHSQLSQFFE